MVDFSTGFAKLETTPEAVEALLAAVAEARRRGEDQMGTVGGIQVVMNWANNFNPHYTNKTEVRVDNAQEIAADLEEGMLI